MVTFFPRGKKVTFNARRKPADFYADMAAGHYEQFNSRVASRFRKLDAERGDDSKVHFVFYTSAPQKKINTTDIEKKFRAQFTAFDAIEVSILFADDIEKKFEKPRLTNRPSNTARFSLTPRKIFCATATTRRSLSTRRLFQSSNCTPNTAQIFCRSICVTTLPAAKSTKKIRETIKDNPASFWFKNNGITIICDDFKPDGCEVKLTNFSIVNGGQTTYMLHKSKNLDAAHDFWLSCKIIKTVGITADEKNAFSLEIAKAANSQKPIKDADLKANSPEQRSFAQAMRTIGIFYQTKRGEVIQSQFATSYLHTKLLDAGKLCLAAIFQEPCKSRSKPSAVYLPEYYEPIFNSNQAQVAQMCKELLYADDYFTKKFLPKFDRENKDLPDAAVRTTFAHIARTICIAFAALAARYNCGNLTDKDVTALIDAPKSSDVYKTLRNLGDMNFLLPIKLYTDAYDAALDNLFSAIIEEGITIYSLKSEDNKSLTAANLKQDENYYLILKKRWATLRNQIRKTFADV